FFFSSRRRHTRWPRDWSSDVCSSDLLDHNLLLTATHEFNPGFTGRLSAGQNLNSRRNRQVFVTGNDLNAPSPLVLQNTLNPTQRSEERRVGKECRTRRARKQ